MGSAPVASVPGPEAAAEDLDLPATQTALKCAKNPKGGACVLLAAFSSCSVWNPVVPSGDGRWIGRGHRVADGKVTEEIVLLRSRRVPLTEVGPGQLPVKIGLAEVPKTDKTLQEQAERALRALERHDVPPRSNSALEYIKKLTDWSESSALRTKAGQLMFLADGDGYVCQGSKQQLMMIKRARGGGPGDGLYAELWATTW